MMPLWKWILALVGGFILFDILYGVNYELFVDGMPDNIVVKPLIIFVGCAFMLCVYWRLSKAVEKRTFSDVQVRKLLPQVGKGFLLGVAFFVVFTFILWALGDYRVSSIHFDGKALFLSLMGFLVVAVGEEIPFRGIIFRLIDERWGAVWALVISCLAFGFAHIDNDNGSVWASLSIALAATESALYFYSKSLWLPIGVHWGWNFVQGNIFGFSVSGLDQKVSLITPAVSGPDLITGGAFGPEASVIMVALCMIVSAWLIYLGFKKRRADSPVGADETARQTEIPEQNQP